MLPLTHSVNSLIFYLFWYTISSLKTLFIFTAVIQFDNLLSNSLMHFRLTAGSLSGR